MIDRRVESDLEWFFNWSEGELGAPSNFMAMVTVISTGCSSRGLPTTDVNKGRLEAAARARHISRSLQRLDTRDRRVLRAVYGPDARELPVLGKVAPVAALTAVAKAAHTDSHSARSLEDWLVRLTWRVSEKLGDHLVEDSATLHAIASEAFGLLYKALRAYERFVPPGRERPVPAVAPTLRRAA